MEKENSITKMENCGMIGGSFTRAYRWGYQFGHRRTHTTYAKKKCVFENVFEMCLNLCFFAFKLRPPQRLVQIPHPRSC